MRKENRVVIHWLKQVKDGINKMTKEIENCKPREIENIMDKHLKSAEDSVDRMQEFLFKLRK